MTLGDIDAWAEVFPDELVPRVIDLVSTTWAVFPKPAADEHEVPITRRFKCALKQAKDYIHLPVRIDREQAEDDPITAQELGRIDLKFSPAGSALEQVYFAFECKRLNVLENGGRRTLAPQYITEGMMRFVSGQYASSMQHGGMIGYVLDGRCDDAIRLVEDNIRSRSSNLKMDSPASLAKSSLRPENQMIRETGHRLSRFFRLHHLFLACPPNEGPPVNVTVQTKVRGAQSAITKKSRHRRSNNAADQS